MRNLDVNITLDETRNTILSEEEEEEEEEEERHWMSILRAAEMILHFAYERLDENVYPRRVK